MLAFGGRKLVLAGLLAAGFSASAWATDALTTTTQQAIVGEAATEVAALQTPPPSVANEAYATETTARPVTPLPTQKNSHARPQRGLHSRPALCGVGRSAALGLRASGLPGRARSGRRLLTGRPPALLLTFDAPGRAGRNGVACGPRRRGARRGWVGWPPALTSRQIPRGRQSRRETLGGPSSALHLRPRARRRRPRPRPPALRMVGKGADAGGGHRPLQPRARPDRAGAPLLRLRGRDRGPGERGKVAARMRSPTCATSASTATCCWSSSRTATSPSP